MKFSKALFVIVMLWLGSVERGGAVPPSADDVAHITVLKGGGVSFIFNAMNRYSNGIVLTDWTVLEISYIDLVPFDNGSLWSLTIDATDLVFNRSSGGATSIPLDCLSFTVIVDSFPQFGPFCLKDKPITVFKDLDFGDPAGNAKHVVKISYSFGAAPNFVKNYPPDFYYNDLSFDLLVLPK